MAGLYKIDVHKEHNLPSPYQTFKDEIFSIGAEDTITITNKFYAIVGLSYDRQKSIKAEDWNVAPRRDFAKADENAWNPQAGLFYSLTDTGKLSLTFEEKTRFPSLKDRYSYRLGTAIPNPDLEPERAQNIYDIPTTFNFLNSLEINIIFNTVIFPPKTSLWILSSKELARIIDALNSAEIQEPQTSIQSANIKTFYGLINQLEYWKDEALEREMFYRGKNVSFEFVLCQYYLKVTSYIKKYKVTLKDPSVIDVIPNSLKEIIDEEVRLKSLLYLFHLPTHWLVSEINFRTSTKLRERVFQVAKDFNDLENSFYE